MDKKCVKVIFEEETIELKNVFIGGRMNDITEAPVGFYGGQMEIGEMSVSLMTLFRTIIKILNDELNIPPNKVEGFFIICFQEALRRENENKSIDNITLETHKIIKKIMENQKFN
jgi:hypothetical protein